MSGALDSTARALATNLIAKYGGPGVITYVDDGVETEEACDCMLDVDARLEHGGWNAREGSVLEGDEFYLIPAAGLPRKPELGDRFTAGDVTYAVIRTKVLRPGLQAVLFTVQVRS